MVPTLFLKQLLLKALHALQLPLLGYLPEIRCSML
jgi:hypothetical protein